MVTPVPRILAALVAALALLVAAGCGDDDDPAAQADRVAVELVLDWFPNADHMGVYGAIDQGYFAEEGLDVEATVPADPAAALKRVGAGRTPFAVSYQPEVLLARAQGIPVVAVGALATSPLNAVIARADRGIARARDLEGKTVGAAGVPSDRALLNTVVAADGGDPAQVRVKNVGFSLTPELAAGRVDAIIGAYWNIEVPELERRGVAVEVLRLEDNGVPDYDELVIVASEETVRERPELIRSFLAGLARGQDWAGADRAGAADALIAANPDLDRELLDEQTRLTAPVIAPTDEPPLTVDPSAWAAYADWMRDNGLLEGPLDGAAAVTDEFLPDDG